MSPYFSTFRWVIAWVIGFTTVTTVLTILERRGLDLWGFTGGVLVGALAVGLVMLPFLLSINYRHLKERHEERRAELRRGWHEPHAR